jgi:peroxiredoxin 2/4
MKTSILLIAGMIFSLGMTWSQKNDTPSVPLIGSKAPSFTAESTKGTMNFPEDYGKEWKILFSHPKDFTPVCSSELLELGYAQRSFKELGANIVVLSTDELKTHYRWVEALEEIAYKDRSPVRFGFPLVADPDHPAYKDRSPVATLYGMVHPNAQRGKNVRGVFFIDPENTVRAIYFYPTEIGRNTTEIRRTLQALQKADDDINVATPANWTPGDPVMVVFPTPLMVENMNKPNSIYFQYSWFMTYRKENN